VRSASMVSIPSKGILPGFMQIMWSMWADRGCKTCQSIQGQALLAAPPYMILRKPLSW